MKEEKRVKDAEVKEFEWYLRDHIFRQSNNNNNQGIHKFQKETLAKEMMNLCLRYRNSDLENLNELINLVSENLLSRKVIKMNRDTDKSLELTSKLSRLQCSKCFYISYLSSNEPQNCLRCSCTELHEFPKRK
ncbi:MAG TPA: hypothetical protein VFJ05_03015 [Nitrososphaeraceae archaeon]|nr:hypothetical protein [Nitrososphaeraceae archaeon]